VKKRDRDDISELVEAQFEPGSRGHVLKNLLVIKKKRDMDEAEAIALKRAVDKLIRRYDKTHKFVSEDIRAIHKEWLGGIYEWAGNYRNVKLSKGEMPFAFPAQIPSLMKKLECGPLQRHTPCSFTSRGRVVEALAEVHTELILIHPFREGNGRTARILATLMALQAGLPLLNFEALQKEKREEYYAAVRAGLDQNYKPMEELFSWVIRETLFPQRGSAGVE
jgi:cell filamentation protein